MKEVPHLYRLLIERLKTRANLNGFVATPDVTYTFGALFGIKKERRLKFLKELKSFGLVDRINTKGIWLKNYKL